MPTSASVSYTSIHVMQTCRPRGAGRCARRGGSRASDQAHHAFAARLGGLHAPSALRPRGRTLVRHRRKRPRPCLRRDGPRFRRSRHCDRHPGRPPPINGVGAATADGLTARPERYAPAVTVGCVNVPVRDERQQRDLGCRGVGGDHPRLDGVPPLRPRRKPQDDLAPVVFGAERIHLGQALTHPLPAALAAWAGSTPSPRGAARLPSPVSSEGSAGFRLVTAGW